MGSPQKIQGWGPSNHGRPKTSRAARAGLARRCGRDNNGGDGDDVSASLARAQFRHRLRCHHDAHRIHITPGMRCPRLAPPRVSALYSVTLRSSWSRSSAAACSSFPTLVLSTRVFIFTAFFSLFTLAQ